MSDQNRTPHIEVPQNRQNVILDREDIMIDYQHSPGGHRCHLNFPPRRSPFLILGLNYPKVGGITPFWEIFSPNRLWRTVRGNFFLLSHVP